MDRDEFWARLMRGEAVTCPCCDRYAKVTKTKLNAVMVKQMLKMRVLADRDGREFVKHKELVDSETGTNACLTTTKHWGFVQRGDESEELKGLSGAKSYWRLTAKGREFLRGDIKVPKYLLLYHDEVYGETGEMIYVHQVGHFDPMDLKEEVSVGQQVASGI